MVDPGSALIEQDSDIARLQREGDVQRVRGPAGATAQPFFDLSKLSGIAKAILNDFRTPMACGPVDVAQNRTCSRSSNRSGLNVDQRSRISAPPEGGA